MTEFAKAELSRKLRNELATHYRGAGSMALPALTLKSHLTHDHPDCTVETVTDCMKKLVEMGLALEVATFGWVATSSTKFSTIGAKDPWKDWVIA